MTYHIGAVPQRRQMPRTKEARRTLIRDYFAADAEKAALFAFLSAAYSPNVSASAPLLFCGQIEEAPHLVVARLIEVLVPKANS